MTSAADERAALDRSSAVLGPGSPRPSGLTAPPSAVLVVTILSVTGIVASLMSTLVIPLISSLPELLDTSAANASWVITATLLSGAVITPISGRLGDMFGKRLMLLTSLALLVAGSVLCASSSDLGVVVVGRVLQGAAAGTIPLGISIMRDELPPHRVPTAIAVMSATLGFGGAIGIPLAAVVAERTHWQVLFWAAAVLGVLCFALVLTCLPESPVRTPDRFDVVGALGLGTGLVALLLAISKGGDWGWASAPTVGCALLALVVFLVWGRFELRTRSPLVNLRVSASRQVLFTNGASLMIGFAMYSMNLAVPQLLMAPSETGYGHGLSMVAMGLVIAPSGIVLMLLSPVSAMLSTRRGPRATLMLGSVVIGVGYLLLLVLTAAPWQVMLATSFIGAGIGLAFAAMPALIMGAVPVTETAAANALNTLMRSIGTSASAAVMGVVLASMTTELGGLLVPSLSGFRVTFVIGAAAAGLACALTALVPGRSATRSVQV